MNEPLKSRREKEKQARYDTILDAAETVFSEKGYDRTSMDDIARTASLSRALLYVYFKDKAAIQMGIMQRAGQNLVERFKASHCPTDTGMAQIRAMGDAYYQFYREEPDYFAALTKASTVIADVDEAQASEMLSSRDELIGLMVAALQKGLEDGTMCKDRIIDPTQTALYLRGALHGVIMLCEGESMPSDTLIQHTMDMLSHSIANP